MTSLYRGDLKHPVRMVAPHDPSEELDYKFQYKASTWVGNTAYQRGDPVSPTVSNGFFYICQSGGRSGSTEPVWDTETNGSTIDGGVEWQSKDGGLLLEFTETIASSSWTASAGVTLGTTSPYDPSFTNTSATVWVIAITDTTLKEFTLSNTVLTNLDRRYVRSMIIKVAER